MENDLLKIEERMKILNSLEPLTGIEKEKFEQYYKVWNVYATAALTNNVFSLLDVKCILEDDMVITGRSLSSHLQIVSLYSALNYIYDCVENKVGLTEEVINTLYSIIAGPSFPTHGPIDNLVNWYDSNKNRLSSVELAVMLGHKFMCLYKKTKDTVIMSLILCNMILIRKGYPLVSIRPDLKAEYIESMKDCQVYTSFMLKTLVQTIDEYIERLK